MKRIIYLFLLLLVCSSCFDDFLTQKPETKATNNNFWKDARDVQSATDGLHALFRDVFGGVTVRLYRERAMPFDYLSPTWRYIAENDLTRTFKPDDPALSWYYEYQVIAQANLIIDNIDRANLTEEQYNMYLGQALTLRAYTYFYIIRIWGDAPLVSHSEDVGEKARESSLVIADFVTNDLIKAAKILPTAGYLKDHNGAMILSKQYCSRGTANAILAHLYAWRVGVYKESELLAKAIAACDDVINSGDYVLADNIKDLCNIVLKGNSREGIFEVGFFDLPDEFNRSGSCMAGVCQKWPVDALATPATRRTLLRLDYETAKEMFDGTARWNEYFYMPDSMATLPTTTTQGAVYIQKFRFPLTYADGSQVGKIRGYNQNEIIIRLADIILLRAELQALAGNSAGAITDLNTIRKRAGAPLYSSNENLTIAIQYERDKELFLEGFSRQYFDAVRTGLFRERLKGGFKNLTDQEVDDGAYYLPVSTDFFRFNSLATQTPYWERNGYSL